MQEVLRATAIIRITERQWDENAPRTISERIARIHKTTREMVETFTNRGEEGFEERLNLLMAEAAQGELEAQPFHPDQNFLDPNWRNQSTRPRTSDAEFDRTHHVQTVGGKLYRARTPPPERRADTATESSEGTEGAALGPLGGPHDAPHPVNHPVSSDACAPQAAGSEPDEGRLVAAKQFAKDSIGRKLLKGNEGQVVGYLSEEIREDLRRKKCSNLPRHTLGFKSRTRKPLRLKGVEAFTRQYSKTKKARPASEPAGEPRASEGGS